MELEFLVLGLEHLVRGVFEFLEGLEIDQLATAIPIFVDSVDELYTSEYEVDKNTFT